MSNLFLSILSGLFLALSFPGPEVGFLVWFGFIFLFISLNRLSSYREVFLFSYLCGLIFFGIVVYWLIHVTFIGAVLLIFYLALYFGAFGLGFKWIENNFKNVFFKSLLIAGLWSGLELIRSHLFTGFGWALLGYSQYKYIKLIQIADIAGAYGLSFVIVFFNASVFYTLTRHFSAGFIRKKKRSEVFIQRWAHLLFAGFLLFICVGYGTRVIKEFEANKEDLIKVSAIQANIAQEFKWDEILKDLILNKYDKLTRMAAFDKPNVIIWPETALPGYLNEEELKIKIGRIAASLSTPLLIGAARFSEDGEDYFNGAAFFDKTGELTAIYDKLHLVPFGEYMPLGRLFSPLSIYYPIADFSKGKDYVLFEVNPARKSEISNGAKGATFGVLICFEDIFCDLARTFVKEGADFMVNITNDAWFKKSPAAYQHNQALVFRAVENKVSIVRVGNTGPSLFVEPTGKINKRLANQQNEDLFIEGFLSANITKGPKDTFFTKFGNVFAYLCLAFFAVSYFLRLRSGKKR